MSEEVVGRSAPGSSRGVLAAMPDEDRTKLRDRGARRAGHTEGELAFGGRLTSLDDLDEHRLDNVRVR